MADKTITMVDYGASNLRSAQKALEHMGVEVVVTADPHIVLQAQKLVLPGVGAFGAGMAALRRCGLDVAVQEAVANGIPLLGICLGMQFLFEWSEEMGQHEGLGLLRGGVARFPAIPNNETIKSLKVPHMGWNQIQHKGTHPLLHGVADGAYGYFVHSYYCQPAAEDMIIAWTDYGLSFASIVGEKNVLGIQFHPEKSQKVGMQILQNFVGMKTSEVLETLEV